MQRSFLADLKVLATEIHGSWDWFLNALDEICGELHLERLAATKVLQNSHGAGGTGHLKPKGLLGNVILAGYKVAVDVWH